MGGEGGLGGEGVDGLVEHGLLVRLLREPVSAYFVVAEGVLLLCRNPRPLVRRLQRHPPVYLNEAFW